MVCKKIKVSQRKDVNNRLHMLVGREAKESKCELSRSSATTLQPTPTLPLNYQHCHKETSPDNLQGLSRQPGAAPGTSLVCFVCAVPRKLPRNCLQSVCTADQLFTCRTGTVKGEEKDRESGTHWPTIAVLPV